ncbi:MAG: 3',5'-cyclic-nucleotide phosphodiesterase [Gammaproteobacteria bacterium]|nr:3',5'-cyclic-nucleotide phosphodiesterase [Gammaproteobacteria bacterium]
MKIRVLGCSGGISKGRHTTSYLINDTILVDAGSGVGELSIAEMTRIEHIFLTHSHHDHVHAIPLLIDSIFDTLTVPIVIHAIAETIEALKNHVFNWVIWPDFAILPHPDAAVMRFAPFSPEERLHVAGLTIETVPVNHIVPTVAYIIRDAAGSFAFSGDTTTTDQLWNRLNALPSLDVLFIETAFSNREALLCAKARHYCPTTLAEDFAKLQHQQTKVYLTHAKPGEEEDIRQECDQLIPSRQLNYLRDGDLIEVCHAPQPAH